MAAAAGIDTSRAAPSKAVSGTATTSASGDNARAISAFQPETRTLQQVSIEDASGADLIFSIPRLIAYCSTFTPLSTGDVILTGTPGGVGDRRDPPLFMKAGDVIEVEISGIGRLVNRIEAEA